MFNREEVMYNVSSLVLAWLSRAEDVSGLEVHFVGMDGAEDTRECATRTECVHAIVNVLCNGDIKGKYVKVRLTGIVDGKENEFGVMDII